MKIINFYTNEKQLIKKSALGDREAQHRLYEKHAPKMLGVCRRYIKDLQFAEDVMVTGFVKVFKHLDSFKFEGSFEGWIRRIMIRESISYLRKQQFVVYDDEVFEAQDDHRAADSTTDLDIEYLQVLIDGLPAGYRTVFVLSVVEGYSHQEIAKMLNITESTSKSQLFKARRQLQEKLRAQNTIGYGTE